MWVVHSGLPPCIGPWEMGWFGVWQRWCVVPDGEDRILAAETDNPDERALCDAELLAVSAVLDGGPIETESTRVQRETAAGELVRDRLIQNRHRAVK